MKYSLISLLVFAVPFSAFAEGASYVQVAVNEAPQCHELIKSCFALEGNERSNCFYASAESEPCKGTTLRGLSLKRWAMSPIQTPGKSETLSFLGPTLVDQNCLRNFDAKLSGAILDNKLSDESVSNLTEELEACKRDITNEILRP